MTGRAVHRLLSRNKKMLPKQVVLELGKPKLSCVGNKKQTERIGMITSVCPSTYKGTQRAKVPNAFCLSFHHQCLLPGFLGH